MAIFTDSEYRARLIRFVEPLLILAHLVGIGAVEAEAQDLPTVSLVLTATSGAAGLTGIIHENGGVMTITATMDKASSTAVSVTISVQTNVQALEPSDNGDFTLSTNTILTFAPQSTSSTGLVTITAVDDNADSRPHKRLRVNAQVTTNNAQLGGVREFLILDDEESPVTTATLTPSIIEENGGICTVTAELSHPSERGPVEYQVQVGLLPEGEGADSSDYTLSTNLLLTIPQGSTASTGLVTITAVDNDEDDPEPKKLLYVRVLRQSGVATYVTSWTPLEILDDEDPPPPEWLTDPGVDAGMGSQLLFIADMAHKNFISVANVNDGRAVTVLVQYHNDELAPVLWYLRVIPGGGNSLVDPFDHSIPGTDDEDGENYTNVSDLLGELPATSFTDEDENLRPGVNSGRFLIVVTAVGANSVDDDGNGTNTVNTANILFPDFLAAGMHGTGNIDNCGNISLDGMGLGYTGNGPQGVFDCREDEPGATENEADATTRNVGPLTVHNYEPVAFNYLLGHHTAAQVSSETGGVSWGVNALVRPAVGTTRGRDSVTHGLIDSAYTVLDGTDDTRLAPMLHGGAEGDNAATDDDNRADDSGSGPPVALEPTPSENNRVVNGGALLSSSLHGRAHKNQRVEFLSVADDYGDPGEYQLIAAKTLYKVMLFDAMGNTLPDPYLVEPVFGGFPAPEPPAGLHILVDGIGVRPNASVAECRGNDRVEGWSLADLTEIVPSATEGTKDFAGLETLLDPAMNASPGWVAFQRTQVTCTEDFGDGDPSDSSIEIPDGVPSQDKRSFIGGTVVVEKETANRTFVTTAQFVLKFVTPNSAFGASWWLAAK